MALFLPGARATLLLGMHRTDARDRRLEHDAGTDREGASRFARPRILGRAAAGPISGNP